MANMVQHAAKLSIGGLILMGIACLVQAYKGFSTLADVAVTSGGPAEISGLQGEELLVQNQNWRNGGYVHRVVERRDVAPTAAPQAHTVIGLPRTDNTPSTSVPFTRIRKVSPDGPPERSMAIHASPYQSHWATYGADYIPAPRYAYPGILGHPTRGVMPVSLRGAYYSPIGPRKPRRRMCFFGPG